MIFPNNLIIQIQYENQSHVAHGDVINFKANVLHTK